MRFSHVLLNQLFWFQVDNNILDLFFPDFIMGSGENLFGLIAEEEGITSYQAVGVIPLFDSFEVPSVICA